MGAAVDARCIGDQAADRSPCTANAQSAIALSRPKSSFARHHRTEKTSIVQRGIKRWVRQMFALSGRVVIKRGSVTRLILNAAYPLIDRFIIAFETLLGPYGVHVCIGKT